MKSKLNEWALRPLNFPSRLTLVKAVLQSMPAYLFSVLAAPKTVLKQIKAIQRNFLWGGTQDNLKWSLVDWKTVCTPKEEGGLGLRNPQDSNLVFNAKIWWRWVNHTSEPWAKLWAAKYAIHWDRHNLCRFQEQVPGSSIWTTVSAKRSLVTDHCFWEIRNGEQAKFWKDAWHQKLKLQEAFPEIEASQGMQDLNKIYVHEYWQEPATM